MLAVCNVQASVELLELTRRINCDLKIVEVSHPHVMVSSGSFTYFGWTPPEPVAVLNKALESDYDVILLSGTFESALPAEITAKIRKKIASGATLFYVAESNRFPSLVGKGAPVKLPVRLDKGVPLAELPVKPEISATGFGKGIVIYIKYPMWFGGLPWTQNTAILPLIKAAVPLDFPYWEYYFAHYGRLLRFAGGERETAPGIIAATVNDGQLRFEISSTQNIAAATASLVIDGPDGRRIYEKAWRGKLNKGINKIALPLSSDEFFRNGKYFLTLLLTAGTSSYDYWTLCRKIDGPNALCSLQLERYCHTQETPVTGKITIRGKGDLHIRLCDTAGRILARRDWKNANGTINFSLLPKSEPVMPLVELRAELFVQGRKADQLTDTLTIAVPNKHKLNFVLWKQGADSYLFANYDRTLSRIGFTVSTGVNTAVMSDAMLRQTVESSLRAGMRFSPMSMHPIRLWKINSLIRTPCLRDPAYRKKVHDDVCKTVERVEKYCPQCYYSGDENSLGHYNMHHDMCRSPYCLAAFREAMRRKYGSLEKLNRLWKANFTSWETLIPPTLAQAEARKNFTPWIEHRLFMMGNVSGGIKALKQELETAAPGARLGFSGQLITNVHGAFNWIDALPAVDNPVAYIRDTDGLPDLIRSFGHPGLSAGAWIGYGAAQKTIRQRYWRQIINGMFSPSFWWYAYFIRRGDGQLTSDGKFLRKLLEEIRESGAEQIFAEAEILRSPIAVFYSLPSLVAATASGLNSIFTSANYTANFNGWTGLLRDLGFQPPKIISHEQLPELTPSACPVLILAMAQMLSDRDIEYLNAYVRNGGLLIADAQPGVFDGFGKRRISNSLDQLFGIKSQPATGGDNSGTAVIMGKTVAVTLSGGKVSSGTGKALGEIRKISKPVKFGNLQIAGRSQLVGPLAVLNRTGKGNTLYLNFLLNGYPGNRLRETMSLPLLRAMKQLFAKAGRPLAKNHQVPPGTCVAEYCADGNRYFGIVRLSGSRTSDVVLNFGAVGYIYDTMTHSYLGKHKQLRLPLPSEGVRTLALLPQMIKSISSNLKLENGKFRLGISGKPTDITVIVRLEVKLNGRQMKEYSANYRVAGKTEITVDPGLLLSPGVWEFKLTDIFSGMHTYHKININGKE